MICVNSFSLTEWLICEIPNSAVHAKSNDTFKKRLDKFWSRPNQEVIYNYHSEIQGTRSRSVIN